MSRSQSALVFDAPLVPIFDGTKRLREDEHETTRRKLARAIFDASLDAAHARAPSRRHPSRLDRVQRINHVLRERGRLVQTKSFVFVVVVVSRRGVVVLGRRSRVGASIAIAARCATVVHPGRRRRRRLPRLPTMTRRGPRHASMRRARASRIARRRRDACARRRVRCARSPMRVECASSPRARRPLVGDHTWMQKRVSLI